jgi:hypothetical protein
MKSILKKETRHFTITNVCHLMLFREISLFILRTIRNKLTTPVFLNLCWYRYPPSQNYLVHFY